MKGATAFLLLSAMSNPLEAHVWDGTGEGERNVPSPLEPRVASCPFRPVAMLLRQKDRESAAINAAGRAVPSDGSWRLCHFPGAIPGNYPYL